MATTHRTQAGAARVKGFEPRATASQMGIVAGILGVAVGTLFGVRPPEAYGVCMACHGRDLVNWLINRLAHAHLEVAPASVVYPVLTTVGVMLGAAIAAKSSGEFRWQNPEDPARTFIYGVLVMNCALLAGGCSIRLLLRASRGEALGLIGFAAMVVGVILGTFWLRWRASR